MSDSREIALFSTYPICRMLCLRVNLMDSVAGGATNGAFTFLKALSWACAHHLILHRGISKASRMTLTSNKYGDTATQNTYAGSDIRLRVQHFQILFYYASRLLRRLPTRQDIYFGARANHDRIQDQWRGIILADRVIIQLPSYTMQNARKSPACTFIYPRQID